MKIVIPAKAGIQGAPVWVPACAGMTIAECSRHLPGMTIA
jgi:hypothetical protein